MEKEEILDKKIEKAVREVDMGLSTNLAKSFIEEMSKQTIAKSQVNKFTIISIIFAITMLICVVSTCFAQLQLIKFMDSIVIERVEEVDMDAQTGDGSGSAINLYGDSNSINADK